MVPHGQTATFGAVPKIDPFDHHRGPFMALEARHRPENILDVSMTPVLAFYRGDGGDVCFHWLAGHLLGIEGGRGGELLNRRILPAPKAWAGAGRYTRAMRRTKKR